MVSSQPNAHGLTESHAEKAHPTVRTYVKVALWLAFVTGIEIVISYIAMPDAAMIASLVVLSLIKFIAVVAYFMHLKFDNPALRKPFVGGLILAIAVYTIVLALFAFHSKSPAGP